MTATQIIRKCQEPDLPAAEQDIDSQQAVAAAYPFLKEAAETPELKRIEERKRRLALRVAEELFCCPTRPSREIAADLGVTREELVELYRVIRESKTIQNALTFDSAMRRRVSFLRRELLPQNRPLLKAMFSGEVCVPNHIEFHPALMCNLRCRACPNCKSDQNGEWYFLGYPVLGEPLDPRRLHLAIDLFLEQGIRDFSFGGGGEPSLSDLTQDGIAYLREKSPDAEISLYTNGIFPISWAEPQFKTLISCVNKIRFSIDAANAQEWSHYKGRPAAYFEVLWSNIEALVEAKKKAGSKTRIGASCLVSDLTCNDVAGFLDRAARVGLNFCDIKAVETCFGEKEEYRAKSEPIRRAVADLMQKARTGYYQPMDLVVDDSLLRDENEACSESAPGRCWVAIRGRMLTVGPYGELYPCSDAANPGAEEKRDYKKIGQLTAFSDAQSLKKEFGELWSASLPQRSQLSKDNCSYCVPSHNNFNAAVEKLYQDWEFGIMPEDQPFAGEPDHYQKSHGS